jgi:hypothetical protein
VLIDTYIEELSDVFGRDIPNILSEPVLGNYTQVSKREDAVTVGLREGTLTDYRQSSQGDHETLCPSYN